MDEIWDERGKGAVEEEIEPGRRWTGWTDGMKAEFLSHLSVSCNVKDAAFRVGVSADACYNLRRRDPAFADGWREALATGYETLETRLVGHALAGTGTGGSRDGDDGAVAADGPIDVDLALKLLARHGRTMSGQGMSSARVRHRTTRQETDEALARLIDTIGRRAEHRRDPDDGDAA